MEAVLTEKSVKLIAVMLSEPKIKAAVYEILTLTGSTTFIPTTVVVVIIFGSLSSIFGTN